VPGSSGYLGRGNARIEAEGDAAAAQVIWPSGKGEAAWASASAETRARCQTRP
jgi:hypothetical protein